MMTRFSVLCLFFLAVAAVAAKPLATFTCKEWLGVDWPRTLVTYKVTFPAKTAKPDMVRLVDADGKEAPVQLSHVVQKGGYLASAWVSFFAELKKNGSYSYSLLPEKSLFESGPKPVIVKDGELPPGTELPGVTLENKLVAIQLPDRGTRIPRPSMMESLDDCDGTNALIPGPIHSYQLLGGSWTYASFFWAADPATAPKATSITSRVTESGQLFSEGVVTYTFDNGGWYTCTIRLVDGDPNIYLDEQCDLKTIRSARDWRVVFPLTDNAGAFKPDAAWWATSGGRLGGKDDAFEAAATTAGFAPLPGNRGHLGSMTFQPAAEKKRLFEMAVWYPYAATAYYAGFTERAKMMGKDAPFVGVMPMHAGNWRGMAESANGEINTYPGGRLAVSWPLVVSPHPNSLLHTGEYDTALPYTRIRRQWALMTGPMQYQQEMGAFRRYNGYITLDDYKDWKLEWPDDPKVTYPRTVANKAYAEAWKPKLTEHPMGEQLKGLLYFTDDANRCKALFTTLASDSYWSSPRGHALRCLGRDGDSQGSTGWVAGFRHAQKAAWTNAADEVLASQNLTPEQRGQLRAWIAASCYALAEPDFNPRGMMAHLGNPNMPMNRFFGLTFAAALIPDHPQANTWLDVSRQYLRYKLAENTAPGGGWSELLTYYMAAASHCMQAGMVLDSQGLLDDATAKLAAQAGSFPIDLLSPKDPRFGTRCLPAWGHEGYWMIPTQWLPVASFTRQRDPQLAKDMVWAWDQLGRPQEDHHDAGFSPRTIIFADLLKELPKDYVPARLASKWIPGFGATMRAHVGDPNETFFSYRQGYMVSHCDANQGDFMLYSKGAPLTTASLFQYAIYNGSPYQKMYESFGWHNRVRFGAQTNTGGWPGGGPISQVHRFFSSDSADYLRGVGDYAPQRWTRQILFLKGKKADGPNYFIFRDSFAQLGEAPLEQKWWYFKSGGETARIAPNPTGLVYTTPWGPKLDIHFLQPASVTAESRQATSKGPLYNRAAMLWKQAGNPLDGSMTEETMTVTAVGPIPAGQDILVALYPRGKDEAAPKYERLAEGAVKITTSEGTDYVFMRNTPMDYKDGDIAFHGTAGAVRVYADAVHLVLAEGPGKVSYRGTAVNSSVPMTQVIPLAKLDGSSYGTWAPSARARNEAIPKNAKAVTVEPGVTKLTFKEGYAWQFTAAKPLDFTRDGVHFKGCNGAIVVNEQHGTVTLMMEEGTRIVYKDLMAWGCEGPYTVTFTNDRIVGETSGLGRFLYLTRPIGLDRLPTLVMDGQTYAPGTSGDFQLGDIAKTGNPYDARNRGGILIVPVPPGDHTFTLRALDQPPIFRNWQAWEK
jgi:hypothetical protein